MTRRKEPQERKEQINLKMKKGLIDRIKQIKNYNPKIEKLVETNIERLEEED